MDILGDVYLTSGLELKVVTAVDDHSRFLRVRQGGPTRDRLLTVHLANGNSKLIARTTDRPARWIKAQ